MLQRENCEMTSETTLLFDTVDAGLYTTGNSRHSSKFHPNVPMHSRLGPHVVTTNHKVACIPGREGSSGGEGLYIPSGKG
jgi:hypothetical protein